MAKSSRIVLPVFIKKGQEYSIDRDEMVNDWWILSLGFSIDREPWGIYFRINWGWVLKDKFKIDVVSETKDIWISTPKIRQQSKTTEKLLKIRESMLKFRLEGFNSEVIDT